MFQVADSMCSRLGAGERGFAREEPGKVSTPDVGMSGRKSCYPA